MADIRVPERVKARLRKPFGKVYSNLEEVKRAGRRLKLVSVGDLSTLLLLCFGMRPHLAVFDFRYHRKRLEKGRVAMLKHEFRHMVSYRNRKGTISRKLLEDAPLLLKKGGAVRIEGEEDLTALAFMRHAGRGTAIVYGQPHEGIVLVKADAATKKRVERIFGEIEKG